MLLTFCTQECATTATIKSIQPITSATRRPEPFRSWTTARWVLGPSGGTWRYDEIGMMSRPWFMALPGQDAEPAPTDTPAGDRIAAPAGSRAVQNAKSASHASCEMPDLDRPAR